MPPCIICDRKFSNRDALLQHLATSSAWHPFCEMCNRRFISKEACDGVSSSLSFHNPSLDSRVPRSICWRNIHRCSPVPFVNEHSTRNSPSMTTIEARPHTQTASSADEDSGMPLVMKKCISRYCPLSVALIIVKYYSASAHGASPLPSVRRKVCLRRDH
jgi:Zinc-finger of C2H2 type